MSLRFTIEEKLLDQLKEDLVCGILQYPGTLGDIKDPSEAITVIKHLDVGNFHL